MHNAAGLALGESLPRVAPALYEHWRAALSAAGVGEAALFSPYYLEGIDTDFQTVFMRLLLRSLGADSPAFAEKALSNYWTTNKRAFEKIVHDLLSHLPQKEAELMEEVQTLLPLIDWQQLREFLFDIVEFDAESEIWKARIDAASDAV